MRRGILVESSANRISGGDFYGFGRFRVDCERALYGGWRDGSPFLFRSLWILLEMVGCALEESDFAVVQPDAV